MEKYDAIYSRQSIDRADSISIESQIEFCQYEIRGGAYKVFKDRGFSGKNTNRPDFKRMMECIHNGEVNRVIVYKLDRISRSILDFTSMMEEFQMHNVEFVSCTEKFDTSTPMGRAMLNICIVFAQLERETIQMRVSDAYISRSRKGFYMGGPVPLGCKLEPYIIDGKNTSRYVIDPHSAEIIRIIFSMYAEPQTSFGDVVRYMKENGIRNPTSKSGVWGRWQISDVVKNPIYARADLDLYRFFKDHGTIIHNSPEEFTGVNGCYLYADAGVNHKYNMLDGRHLVLAPHEGVIPSDIWITARIKCMSNKQVAKPLKASNTWLVGKIKCGKCGHALRIRKGCHGTVRYFHCSRKETMRDCAGAGLLHADEVEANILSRMREYVKQFSTPSQPTCQKENPAIHELNIKLEQISVEIDSLMDKVSSANSILMGYINKRVSELDAQGKAYKQQLIDITSSTVTPKYNIVELSTCLDHWDELDFDDKRNVVDQLISKVEVTDEFCNIHWKYTGVSP